MKYVYKRMLSPVGSLKLVADECGLAAILWENDAPDRVRIKSDIEENENPILLEAERQLKEYFAGKRESFSVPLHPLGTEFQTKVWAALTTIPFGETRSYGQIAEQVKSPKAVRAVGAANGRNPISIMVPCHRVIGASGALTGFAGGLDVKAQLLRLEGMTNQREMERGSGGKVPGDRVRINGRANVRFTHGPKFYRTR